MERNSMDYLEIYTSTGNKLVHHPVVVNKIKRENKGTPVSISVGPTSRCNLNCSFCSNANRTKHEDLDREELITILGKLRVLGLKTIEMTGGGDPTMYEHINFIIAFAEKIGLEQGMITNGILLREKVTQENLNRLKWLRISMNCLDYVWAVDIPKIKGTLGFSYVMNVNTSESVLKNLHEHVEKYNPKYVRIVTNCLATDEEQRFNNNKYGAMVEKMGPPYFYQPKEFQHSNNCYWCYFKPFLLHDGYVYPCSSVVLNSDANGKFHEKYRWCKMTELSEMYEKKMVSFDVSSCNHCVFKSQNDLVDMILNPEMENFV